MEDVKNVSDSGSISSNSDCGGTWLNEDNVDEILGHLDETVIPEKKMKVHFQIVLVN